MGKTSLTLERILQIPPHQSLEVSAPTLQVRVPVTHCTLFMRHRHYGEFSAEGGRDLISRSLPPVVGNSPNLPPWADSPACHTHSIPSGCDSRQSIILHASVHGVADQPPSFPVDLRFVTCCKAQLQDYLSPFPDISVKGIDAPSHTWDFPGVLYAYPRTPLLTAILGRIRATLRPALLLAPTWPKQLWYSFLVELSVVHMVHLPLNQFALLQGNFTRLSSKMFNLHAWALLVTGLEDRDSLRALPAS